VEQVCLLGYSEWLLLVFLFPIMPVALLHAALARSTCTHWLLPVLAGARA
jgi:hypothetical protein